MTGALGYPDIKRGGGGGYNGKDPKNLRIIYQMKINVTYTESKLVFLSQLMLIREYLEWKKKRTNSTNSIS